jgi:hypothetical protein
MNPEDDSVSAIGVVIKENQYDSLLLEVVREIWTSA